MLSAIGQRPIACSGADHSTLEAAAVMRFGEGSGGGGGAVCEATKG
jgi:hypothetical protein